jgi:hypothetical protein
VPVKKTLNNHTANPSMSLKLIKHHQKNLSQVIDSEHNSMGSGVKRVSGLRKKGLKKNSGKRGN